MAFVCPEKCERRKSLLSKLKDLVSNIDDKCCAPPCPAPCGPPCVPACPPGPVIEIYDPLPKPCLPVCSPCPAACPAPCCPSPCPAPCCPSPCPAPCCPSPCPAPCCPSPCAAPCCPPPVCPPLCTPPQCGTCPVPLCAPACPLSVPPCLPICTPVPPPCIPVQRCKIEEQPCVPCNPPQMMVCYRMPKCCPVRASKSRELRASILYTTCDCLKRNGLQDDCPRSECHGSPACLALPDPCCGPAEAARRFRESKFGKNKHGLEQYQCYPAYIKLPGGPSPCCPPACCPGNPCVPLVAAPPCPPPICPCPPPLLPVGNVMPVCSPCKC